jgi:hypothetical protein
MYFISMPLSFKNKFKCSPRPVVAKVENEMIVSRGKFFIFKVRHTRVVFNLKVVENNRCDGHFVFVRGLRDEEKKVRRRAKFILLYFSANGVGRRNTTAWGDPFVSQQAYKSTWRVELPLITPPKRYAAFRCRGIVVEVSGRLVMGEFMQKPHA